MIDSRTTRLLCVLCAVATFALGCGDTEEEANAATNVATNVATNNATTNNNATTQNVEFCEENDGAEWGERYSMRMDTLTSKPGNAGFELNTILSDGFDQTQNYPVVVLVDIKNLDADAGTLELRGGAGLKTEMNGEATEEYEWDPDALEDFYAGTFDPACGALNTTIDLFEFVASFESEQGVNKVVLPINQLEIEAAIALEGTTPSISQGELKGYITKEQADEATIQLSPGGTPIPLTLVFAESTLDYNTETGERLPDGERGPANADAWYLEATFTAIETTIIE